MTTPKLQALIAEAVANDRALHDLAERQKEIKKLLIEEAEARADEHEPGDGGGTRWTATAEDGAIARVSFPAETLKGKIDGEGKAIEKIKALAGPVFTRLFLPSVSYKPAPNFRDEARALLPKVEAGKLIKLCQTESAPRVSFETAERSAE
jgi:hypothetical protein